MEIDPTGIKGTPRIFFISSWYPTAISMYASSSSKIDVKAEYVDVNAISILAGLAASIRNSIIL